MVLGLTDDELLGIETKAGRGGSSAKRRHGDTVFENVEERKAWGLSW